MAHVVNACGKLAQTEYKGRQDNVARHMHWQLCGKCGLERPMIAGMKKSRREW